MLFARGDLMKRTDPFSIGRIRIDSIPFTNGTLLHLKTLDTIPAVPDIIHIQIRLQILDRSTLGTNNFRFSSGLVLYIRIRHGITS